MNQRPDFLIIGGGIVGLAVARAYRAIDPACSIVVLEKEDRVATHSSGRNSGVVHAGFYYSADSLKARLCVEGARKLRSFCEDKQIPITQCGQFVVAQNATEVDRLYDLQQRGEKNGVPTEILTAAEARLREPNLRTFDFALWSPLEAVGDPNLVSQALVRELLEQGVEIHCGARYLGRTGKSLSTSLGNISPGRVINCAGLYADTIARDFGFSERFTIIPFKGIYLKYSGAVNPLRTHVYPVPSPLNPFLGVHFTQTAAGGIKIGPTAIPALWRENYHGLSRFKLDELLEILFYETKLLITNRFNFRNLAFEELQKFFRARLIRDAKKLATGFDWDKFDTWGQPGIRAQLIDIKTLELVQDFVIEGDAFSTHILNAVSPGWTSSLAFGEYAAQWKPVT